MLTLQVATVGFERFDCLCIRLFVLCDLGEDLIFKKRIDLCSCFLIDISSLMALFLKYLHFSLSHSIETSRLYVQKNKTALLFSPLGMGVFSLIYVWASSPPAKCGLVEYFFLIFGSDNSLD